MNKKLDVALKIGKILLTAYGTFKAAKALAGAVLELRNRGGNTILDSTKSYFDHESTHEEYW